MKKDCDLMKAVLDKNGRKLYKFNHSVRQGGHMYARRLISGRITDKDGLQKTLFDISSRLNLIDTTVKVYDNIFFVFCLVPPSLAPESLITAIQENTAPFGEWDSEYVWVGVYDLQEKFVRKDLENMGFGYDKG